MKASKSIIWIMALFVALLLVVPQTLYSKTSAGATPSTETVCDEEGLTGSALGLCNAYCEAMDCDTNPKASESACNRVLDIFQKTTGGDPPCIGGNSGD